MTGKQTWVRSGVMWSVGIHLSCIAIIMFFSTFAIEHNEIVQIILTLDPSIGGGGGGGGGRTAMEVAKAQEIATSRVPVIDGSRRKQKAERARKPASGTTSVATKSVTNDASLQERAERGVEGDPMTKDLSASATMVTSESLVHAEGAGSGGGIGTGTGSGIGTGTGAGTGSGSGSGLGSGTGSGIGRFSGPGYGGHDSPESLRNRYLRTHFAYIRDLILKNITYPLMAKKHGWQGNTRVSFVIREDGKAEQLKIVKSSGYEVLDRNVVETVSEVQPFPRPPVRAEIVIPVVYTIKKD